MVAKTSRTSENGGHYRGTVQDMKLNEEPNILPSHNVYFVRENGIPVICKPTLTFQGLLAFLATNTDKNGSTQEHNLLEHKGMHSFYHTFVLHPDEKSISSCHSFMPLSL